MASKLTRGSGPAAVSRSGRSEIEAFLGAAKAGANEARLIFALDATMSRQPTWDQACRFQSEMFEAVGDAGDLSVQLIYFRGFSECRASNWLADTRSLRELMLRIDCRGGRTQIGKILTHARRETGTRAVGALIFIGDAMEEDADRLCHVAGELGVLGLRCFMFQEGRDPATESAFREIARISGGAYMRFDSQSADALRNLLRAVARFISKGLPALENETSREARLLLGQLSPPRGPISR